MNNLRDKLMEIKPTDEQKSRMLSGIKNRSYVSSGKTAKKIFRVAAIAAALCCVLVMTVFADEIGGFIAGVFTEDEIVGDTVRTCVYYDKDEHIEMTVEEVLSDMQTVRMVILYTALDEEGEEWLSQLSRYGIKGNIYGDDETLWYGFDVCPDMKPSTTGEYLVNWAVPISELEEYRTDTQRRFVVGMEADSDNWGSNDIFLYYMMTDYGETEVKKVAVLDVSTNIEKRTYTLDSTKAPDKLYKPTDVTLSPLSLKICGDNLGFFKIAVSETEDGLSCSTTILAEEKIDSLYLVLTDGQRINLLDPREEWNDGYWGLGSLSHDDSRCHICSISFLNPIDMDTIAGIELDGVYYPFEIPVP